MKIAIITAGWRRSGVENVIKNLDKQTYKDWTEHIIVNDNSKEVREFFQENNFWDDNPKRFCIDAHIRGGYYGAHARSTGAIMAFHHMPERVRKADQDLWICFWDDDNEFYPDFFERMMKAHEAHPEAVLLGADIEIIGKINKDYKHVMRTKIYPQNCDLGCFLYKKEMFDKYGYFPASLRYKITYDWEMIKKIVEGEGHDKVYIDHDKPGLIFYHKER